MANNNDKQHKTPDKRLTWIGGGAAVALAAAMLAWAVGAFSAPQEKQYDEAEFYTVQREPLVISVNQPGQIEARNKIIIKSQIRDRMTIEWIIDEGTIVKPGDVLVKFDTTTLLEKQTDLEQKRDNAKSALVAARVVLENTTSQNESDIEQAKLNVEFAKLTLRKYLEGEYPQDLNAAHADVELTKITLANANTTLGWSRKLLAQKYITESQYKADEASAKKAELDLKISEGKLKLLEKYDYTQQKRKLESDRDQTAAKLMRVKNKAQADLENAKIKLGTAQANLVRIQRHLDQAIVDIKNSIIPSPVAGHVVYAPQGNAWRRKEPLSKGSEVRYNQEIIHIPEAGAMVASIKIDESQRDKVKIGMPVILNGPNIPDAGLTGKLATIAEYLDPSGWWNNNMKVYSAKVDIDGDPAELRTGMNCQTQIIVASYDNVLTVPIQAVTRIDDQHVVYMLTPSGLKPHPVEIGLDNGRKVHILSGLKQGDRVSLTPPLQPAGRKDEPLVIKKTGQAASSQSRVSKAPGQPVSADVRLFSRLVSARRRGMLDKLGLDSVMRQKLDAALDEVQAGQAGKLDPKTLAAVRAAMPKLRSTLPPKPNDHLPPANGETHGHGKS